MRATRFSPSRTSPARSIVALLATVSVAAASVAAVSVTAGCSTELGECDPDLARTVVYDETGFPAYEGQAQVQVSCGNGAFCHAEGASGDARRGAPVSLDFDLSLASVDGDPATTRVDRLERNRAELLDMAHEAFCLVEAGEMPPFGEAVVGIFDNVPRYSHADGRRVPPIDSIEGLERYRNWLACDVPVVERTEGASRVGDTVPGR